jgi:hypothetical protein
MEGGLHGSGRNDERLNGEGLDEQRHGDRDDEHAEHLPKGGPATLGPMQSRAPVALLPFGGFRLAHRRQ